MQEKNQQQQPQQHQMPLPPETKDSDQAIEDAPIFKRKRVILPLFILLVVIVAGVWYWYIQQFTAITTDDAFIEADRMTVSSKIPGRIMFLPYDENDTIRSGDTIVRLDDNDLRSQLNKSEAAVTFYKRSSDVAAVSLVKAKDDYERAVKQYNSQVIPQEQYSHAENALKLAKAQTNLAASQIATAQADCDVIKTQLGNTIVTAPLGGVVAKRWVLPGDVVSAGQAIYSIFDRKDIRIIANFEETKLHNIAVGDNVIIRVDALPDTVFNGTVIAIGQSTASQFALIPPSNASGNFTKTTQRVPVKIVFDASAAANSRLLPGLSAYVRVIIRHK